VRSSGLAILYAMSVTIFGGTTQFVVTWLIDRTNDAMVPAWYQIVANVAGIIGVVLLMPHAEVVRGRAGQPNPSFASTGHGVTETRS
jgi:MHS family citrate/tricarballylate:H+ symporter-like MFS transporter